MANYLISVAQRVFDDDDPKRQAPLHIGQRRRILGPLDGKYTYRIILLCLPRVHTTAAHCFTSSL